MMEEILVIDDEDDDSMISSPSIKNNGGVDTPASSPNPLQKKISLVRDAPAAKTKAAKLNMWAYIKQGASVGAD